MRMGDIGEPEGPDAILLKDSLNYKGLTIEVTSYNDFYISIL
jgi:hypothetical protein